MAFIDVTLPAGSFTPTLQDFVRASHASLSDTVLGAANAGLTISARMVAPSIARVMIENRYNAGPVDGQWGQSTADAVRKFQASAGLPVTGELGPNTLNALGVS
jgi:peptidoglycan hydrolase-like protein with peptidoglycan-binding domain